MVKVSRDKQRHGTVAEMTINNVGVKFDCSDVVMWHRKDAATVVGDEIIKNDKSVKTAIKHDSKKNRLELIPVSGIEGIGRAMTFGATKYAAHNWANGFDYSRLCGSAMRHLLAWMSGQDKDPESGLSHLDHLGACVVILIAHETEGLGNDDRRKTND
jgi:hypothetical protein